MQVTIALATARADAARLERFIYRRERFLDALDWSSLSEEHARQSAMLDEKSLMVTYKYWRGEPRTHGTKRAGPAARRRSCTPSRRASPSAWALPSFSPASA